MINNEILQNHNKNRNEKGIINKNMEMKLYIIDKIEKLECINSNNRLFLSNNYKEKYKNLCYSIVT